MSERKLKAWQEAGLIDAETADHIRSWEASHSRSTGMWAIMSIGALTIGLGIISVVAANWDAIAGEVRLGIHLGLIAALSALLWRYVHKPVRSDWISDCGLAVLAVLGLTFFAHIGQVYQTSSPLWQPLLAWLVVFSPLLLSHGRGWPVVVLWVAGVVITAICHADQYGNILPGMSGDRALAFPGVYWGLILSTPMGIAALAAGFGRLSTRTAFWRQMEALAVAVILTGLSLAIIIHGWDGYRDVARFSVAIQCLALMGAGAVIMLARPTRSGRARAAILAAAALVHFLSSGAIGPMMGERNSWISALFFVALWGAVAGAALYAHWRGTFQIAIAIIALRIMILSVELNDDLLSNGLGLIFSGLLAIAIAWVTARISKRFAPARRVKA